MDSACRACGAASSSGLAPDVGATVPVPKVRRIVRSAPPSSKWVVTGWSQGGGAALFTASMATGYAPELDYRGAVASGPASNVVEALALVGPQTPIAMGVAYTTYIINGLKAARPDLDTDSYLTPLGRQLVTEAQTLCGSAMDRRVQGITLDSHSASAPIPGLLLDRLCALPAIWCPALAVLRIAGCVCG